jgi:tetratricopeptide (TPR) repeat protein
MKNIITSLLLLCTITTYAGNFVDSAKFYFGKGMEEKNAKRYLLAAKNFDKAINFDKNYTEAYIENGYVNLEMRKVDAAKVNFTKAYQLEPTNSKVIKELTELYYNGRQWDKAIEFAQKCSNCDNTDRMIGMANFEKEEYAIAETYLLKAIAKNPADAEATYTLGRNYLDMEAFKKAVPYYEKAITMQPDKNAWAYELALLYYNNKDFKNAVSAFEKAAANGFFVNNDYNENYGYALLYSGQFAKGEEKLMAVYQKKTSNKEIIRDLAQILYGLKQYNRSLDYCQRLLEMDANDSKALYQAGLGFQKLGQVTKGQGMCDKAIQMDPSLASKRVAKADESGGL